MACRMRRENQITSRWRCKSTRGESKTEPISAKRGGWDSQSERDMHPICRVEFQAQKRQLVLIKTVLRYQYLEQ